MSDDTGCTSGETEVDWPFFVAVRAGGESELFGFKTPKIRDAFISDIGGSDGVEWARGHHPEAGPAFIRNLLGAPSRGIVDALPTEPGGLLSDLLRQIVGDQRAENGEEWRLIRARLREASQLVDRTELGTLLHKLSKK